MKLSLIDRSSPKHRKNKLQRNKNIANRIVYQRLDLASLACPLKTTHKQFVYERGSIT